RRIELAVLMNIGIASHHNDMHALAVKAELERNFGISCHVLECDRLGLDENGLRWLLGEGAAPLLMSSEKISFDIRALDLLWFRRGGFGQETVDGLADPAYLQFTKENYSAAGLGAFASEFTGIWVDHPRESAYAENKVVQNHVAHNAGFLIPR